MEMIGATISTFFLFILVFPLVGALATLSLRVLLPYLLGPALVVTLLDRFLFTEVPWGGVFILGIGWSTLLLMTRTAIMRKGTSLPWHEGHYRTMFLVLSLGIPLWIGKTTAGEAAAELECEVEGAGASE